MEYKIKHYKKNTLKKNYSYFVLGGDIGGTNTNLGIFGIKNKKPVLLFSLHFKSQKINSLIPSLNLTLEYAKENHKISINKVCIAAAGPVSVNHNYCQLVNAKWNINARDILKKTPLKSVFIINDFEAIGYSVNLMELNKDIFKVKHEKHLHKGILNATKAIIGAGTGVGKTILVYSNSC